MQGGLIFPGQTRTVGLKAFKIEKNQPKEGEENKIPTDRPMFWHLEGNTPFFEWPNDNIIMVDSILRYLPINKELTFNRFQIREA